VSLKNIITRSGAIEPRLDRLIVSRNTDRFYAHHRGIVDLQDSSAPTLGTQNDKAARYRLVCDVFDFVVNAVVYRPYLHRVLASTRLGFSGSFGDGPCIPTR